jgi:DNA repair exonuclease SbcCD ATPase subunit
MHNLNIKYAAAYNFLPFGPEGIQLNFDKFKNIVLVRGENRDAKQLESTLPSDEMKVSSNGSGKSSIQEIITYALFGKTVKRPEKLGANDVVHNKVGKDAKVEIIFDKYRIIRTRKEGGNDRKNGLRLWESDKGVWDKDSEITQGTMAATQEKIESIIGLSYDAFINICIFTDDQRACFLECDNKQKKEIVENMLSLGQYREWFENAKSLRKEIKQKVDVKSKEYTMLLGSKDAAVKRLELTKQKDAKWLADRKSEYEDMVNKFNQLANIVIKSDNGAALIAYEEAQAKIKEINEKTPQIEASKKDVEEKLELARIKETELKNQAQTIANEYADIARESKNYLADRKAKEQEIADLRTNKPGTRCGKCRSEVLEENIEKYVEELNNEIILLNAKLEKAVKLAKEVQDKASAVKEKQDKIKTYITQFLEKIEGYNQTLRIYQQELVKASQVREPKTTDEEAVLQEKIKNFKEKMETKKNEMEGNSPFHDIIANDEVELEKAIKAAEEKEYEVKELEAELPYFDYWVTGFGDHGIRKWIIDGIVPELNNRINYWLQFLIDNRITLTFDNELNEKIERNPVDGDPYIYHAMSTGQRRRLNLAVSQSFAHIMMMSSGAIPSLVFLDEVSTNVDPLGVQGIYNMITELAEDKQVFITTHDPDLIRMLEGSDTLRVVHENGFTRLCED